MLPTAIQRWLRISLFSLLLVAFIGTILRYKIAYSLPFVDQKYLMHAHSHFAFTGWISMALMTLMLAYLAGFNKNVFKKYQWIFIANIVTAYGMLFTFPFEGYGMLSISFSTLSIFANYFFAFTFWKDLDKLKHKDASHYWFKAALFFNVLSSLGTYALAWMMLTKNIHQDFYLASIYFYLHFQYNGWFFFACMGLFTARVLVSVIPQPLLKKIFWLFFLACIPAYFLSTLWMHLPVWAFILIVAAAFAQLTGWVWLIQLMRKQWQHIKNIFSVTARRILLLSAVALTLKLLLQLGSTIPSLSILAFGFRPIVIGYLHLVLLGVISLFILGYMIGLKYVYTGKSMTIGTAVFVVGVIVNEVLLMIQGITGMDYINVPYINELLLIAACTLFSGILIMNISQWKKTAK